MAEDSFHSYARDLFDSYQRGEYARALEIALDAEKKFPKRPWDTIFWIACLNSLLGRKDEAINQLAEGLRRGVWWGPKMLQRETDFDNIRNEPGFLDIVQRCEAKFSEANRNSRPECQICHPAKFSPDSEIPLFMTLHWRYDNTEDFRAYWEKPVLQRNYLLAVPQSSQIAGSNKYCWDDADAARNEIRAHLQQMAKSYRIDWTQSIIAGACQGARLALEMALEDIPHRMHRVLMVLPALADVDSLMVQMENCPSRRLRGYIITGSRDQYIEQTRKLFAETERLKIPFDMEIIEGLGHAFPEDFDFYLNNALFFLSRD
jgi:predicted esterase